MADADEEIVFLLDLGSPPTITLSPAETAALGMKLVEENTRLRNALGDAVATTVTRAEMMSVDAIVAFNLAQYKMRKNARYDGWSTERRLQYALGKAFDAAVVARNGEHQPEPLREMTEKALTR